MVQGGWVRLNELKYITCARNGFHKWYLLWLSGSLLVSLPMDASATAIRYSCQCPATRPLPNAPSGMALPQHLRATMAMVQTHPERLGLKRRGESALTPRAREVKCKPPPSMNPSSPSTRHWAFTLRTPTASNFAAISGTTLPISHQAAVGFAQSERSTKAWPRADAHQNTD